MGVNAGDAAPSGASERYQTPTEGSGPLHGAVWGDAPKMKEPRLHQFSGNG